MVSVKEDRHVNLIVEAADHGRDLACPQIRPLPLRDTDDNRRLHVLRCAHYSFPNSDITDVEVPDCSTFRLCRTQHTSQFRVHIGLHKSDGRSPMRSSFNA